MFITFTQVALTFTAWAAYCDDDHLWGVACAAQLFVNVSFHLAILLDASCFRRMRSKHRWPLWMFHLGNVTLHWFPAAIAWRNAPVVHPFHVTCAYGLFLAWLGAHAEQAPICDRIYVSLRPRHWHLCTHAGFAAAAITASLTSNASMQLCSAGGAPDAA